MLAADPPSRPTPWRRWRQSLGEYGPAAPLLLVAVTTPILGTTVLAATTAAWLPWLEGGALAGPWFVAAGTVAAAAFLLPTHVTSLVAGFAFGPVRGPLYAWLVILLAATAGFLLLRRLVGERVVQAVARSPRAAAVTTALLAAGQRRAFGLIALLRLSPLLPFAATNLLLAALRVPLRVFLPATLVGITPRAVGAALLGAELHALDFSAGGGGFWTVLAITATVAVMVWIGRVARAALRARLSGTP